MDKSRSLLGFLPLIFGFLCEYSSAAMGSYYIHGFVGQNSEITQDLAVDIIQDAFDVWSCYIGIKFKREHDPQNATIFVVFGSANHSEFLKGGRMSHCEIQDFSTNRESGFGIAAHSTLLHDRQVPANIHLHNKQVWTYGKKRLGSRSLFEVVVHEIGHLFGISHDDVSRDPNAVMTTGHRNFVPPNRFDLTRTDLQALRKTAFGKLLARKGMLKMHCSHKPWQRKMEDRRRRVRRCRDLYDECHRRASFGYCETQYEAAIIGCRSTCSFCECKDQKEGCRREECIKNDFIKTNLVYCRKTCGLCTKFVRPWVMFENTYFAMLPCVDELPSNQCVEAKTNEMCKYHRAITIMRKFCRKTCGFC